jgi:CRP/FNR family transcriptional regulator, cyclic AMP receptor protein
MILRRDEKVELISRIPLFARCSKRELVKIASRADQVDVPDEEVLTQEGKPGREFFVLVEGSAEVLQGSRRVATLGRGDFLGEIALLTNAPRTATVRTTTPVSVLVMTSREFSTLLHRFPDIERKILRAVADRLAPTAL